MTTEELWKEFHKPLKRFISMKVTDHAAAEDILQNVFLKIYTRLDTLWTGKKN